MLEAEDMDNDGPVNIIGGVDLPEGKHPYLINVGYGGMAVVGEKTGHWCGGTPISPKAVLTAAHCHTCTPTNGTCSTFCTSCSDSDKTFEAFPYWVEFNRYDLTSGPSGVDRRTLSTTEGSLGDNDGYVIRHPDYDAASSDLDFARIILDRPVTEITPVGLNAKDNIPANTGNDLEVFGWGNTNPDPNQTIAEFVTPEKPQIVTVGYIPKEQCETTPFFQDTTDNMLCAYTPKKDSCQGNSGM